MSKAGRVQAVRLLTGFSRYLPQDDDEADFSTDEAYRKLGLLEITKFAFVQFEKVCFIFGVRCGGLPSGSSHPEGLASSEKERKHDSL